MSTNPQLRQETAQDIRLRRDMERQIDTDAGRAKIIETFAETLSLRWSSFQD